MLTIQTIPMKFGLNRAEASAVTLFDSGSVCSFVSNEFAWQHRLYGEEVLVGLATVNRTRNYTTKLYLVELVDMDGNTQVVRAFGLDSVSVHENLHDA